MARELPWEMGWLHENRTEGKLAESGVFWHGGVLAIDPEDSGKVDPKAEVLITVRWPDGHPDDIDTIVEFTRTIPPKDLGAPVR